MVTDSYRDQRHTNRAEGAAVSAMTQEADVTPDSSRVVVEPDDLAQEPISLRRRPKRSLASYVGPIQRGLFETGEMVILTSQVTRNVVRHPRGLFPDFRDQCYLALKLCWIPMVVSTIAFGLGAPGLQGGNIYLLFGVPERLGSFFVMASFREFAPWINAMVVAGVIGTAVTADLGARKIREEVDAMLVLGVDPIRSLVVPRVLAISVMTALLDVLAVIFGSLGGWIASAPLYGATSGGYISNLFANATIMDLWGSVGKSFIFGLIIGVVCCYKGLAVKGGPAGVGRAVNQAVVAAFAGIWIFNYAWTNIILGLNPSMQIFK